MLSPQHPQDLGNKPHVWMVWAWECETKWVVNVPGMCAGLTSSVSGGEVHAPGPHSPTTWPTYMAVTWQQVRPWCHTSDAHKLTTLPQPMVPHTCVSTASAAHSAHIAVLARQTLDPACHPRRLDKDREGTARL